MPKRSSEFIIIGAGPAGLAAAIAYGEGALVLERNSIAGKKLLLSGAGQCNFSNAMGKDDFLSRCGKAAHFLKPALYSFDNHSFIDLLQQAGCPSIVRADGKVFPASLSAKEVRDTLLSILHNRGAIIEYGCTVQKLERKGDGFELHTQDKVFVAKQVLLATGGCSYPLTGSDGLGLQVAAELGYDISPILPALCGIELQRHHELIDCAGVVIKAAMLYPANHKAIKAPGDILFTHKGLSGPGILDHVHLMKAGDILHLALVQDAERKLVDMQKAHPQREILRSLKAFEIPESFVRILLANADIAADTKLHSLNKKQRQALSNLLERFPLSIKNIEPLATAMASAGGIMLSQLKARTMASKLHPGLYFAGEMLDYSLPSGGFNIQAAFSTGYLAGLSAKAGSL